MLWIIPLITLCIFLPFSFYSTRGDLLFFQIEYEHYHKLSRKHWALVTLLDIGIAFVEGLNEPLPKRVKRFIWLNLTLSVLFWFF
jgi:uncharacterized protein (DUF486 family)